MCQLHPSMYLKSKLMKAFCDANAGNNCVIPCFLSVIVLAGRGLSCIARACDKPSRGPHFEQLLPVAVWIDGERWESSRPRHLANRSGHMFLEE